jgi:hypothetical protein
MIGMIFNMGKKVKLGNGVFLAFNGDATLISYDFR